MFSLAFAVACTLGLGVRERIAAQLWRGVGLYISLILAFAVACTLRLCAMHGLRVQYGGEYINLGLDVCGCVNVEARTQESPNSYTK